MSADNVALDRYDEALWELALRLVPPQWGPSGASDAPARIWPGGLPDLPFTLPVPRAARIIGSYGRGDRLTVLIDTDLAPKDFVAFYEVHLPPAGWSTPAWLQGPGGFVGPQMAKQAQTLLCRGPEGPGVSIAAETGTDAITHATLTISLDPENNPCRPPVAHAQQAMPTGPHIPPLEAPAGSTLISHGVGNLPALSTALATLSTDLDLQAILAHYSQQLVEGGWKRIAAGVSGPVAWSTWSFVDLDRRPAHAILTVVREPNEAQRYILSLHAREGEPNPPDGERSP